MNTVLTELGRFYGWISLSVVAVMYFIMVGFLLYTFQVFLPFLCDEFGWSRASVSWANSLALVVMGISALFAGKGRWNKLPFRSRVLPSGCLVDF